MGAYRTHDERTLRGLPAVFTTCAAASLQLPKAQEAGSVGLFFRNIGVGTFGSPNAALSVACVDPEGTLVTTRWAKSERVATVNRVGVWKPPSGCRTESTTAVGGDVLSVAPESAAEYDRGLGVPMRAAPLGGSQCEPVTARSYGTAEGENNLWGVGSKVGEPKSRARDGAPLFRASSSSSPASESRSAGEGEMSESGTGSSGAGALSAVLRLARLSSSD